MILRRAASPTSLLQVQSPSPDASPCPSIFSAPSVVSWADDDAMSVSTEQQGPSRPLSSAPSRIPTLREILANQSTPPYTLSAFAAYLSQKQCLENLEFTMEAQRYAQRYDELAAEMIGMPMSDEIEGCRELSHTWQRLLNAYISTGAPKEVNIPDHIRRDLLQSQDGRGDKGAPPAPEVLERAVEHIHELMDESVMMGFISELAPRSPAPAHHHHSQQGSLNELGISGLESDEEKKYRNQSKLSVAGHSRARSRSRQKYSPEHASGSDTSLSASAQSMQPPRISTANTSGGLSAAASRRSVGSGNSGDVPMEDVSMPSSPSEMMTPPTTPPGAEFGGNNSGSPRTRTGENAFRKMMGKFGGKKKSSSGSTSYRAER